MEEQIICQRGKCFEAGSIESEFDSLFDDTNIVDNIQHDLLRDMIR